MRNHEVGKSLHGGRDKILFAVNEIEHTGIFAGSKGRKSDASLLAGGFLNLGPAKNMSKEPFFEEK